MKLKKLEIHGFKSFPEKTTIHFPPGISAVVGPNGCGKSNIVDAIRWVMGEQSVKRLRGKSMEDVIFAGTDGNPPLNMAEVSLTMINDNGSAPRELKDYAEIMLTRRLYRSGESSYLLNKRPCRLKDIQHVFLGSGLATRSYAIISQGNVGTFTEAGPEERRYFLEEAAGITRYKARKDETLRKIKQTHQNLLRIQDIISEIEHQLTSLKRQVRKAERFREYQARVRRLDIQLGVQRYEDFRKKIAATEKLITTLRETDMGHMAALKKIDAAIEAIKVKRIEKERRIGKKKAEKFEAQRTADRLENNLAHLRQDSGRLAAEITDLENAHQELQQKNHVIQRDIQTLENESRALQKQLEGARSRLVDEKDASADVRQRLAGANAQLEQYKGVLMDLVAREARHKSICQAAQSNRENLQRRIKQAAEQEALANRKLAALEAEHARAQARQREIEQQLAGVGAGITDSRAKLEKQATAFGDQARRTQALELKRHKLASQHDALKKMQDSFEWYRGGVKAVMQQHAKAKGRDGIIGPLADILEPQAGFETAAEAVLGESLQYVMVADQSAGAAAIRYLSRENAGRSGFIPMASVKAPDSAPAARPDPDRCLRAHVRTKPGFEKIGDALLGHVAVCDDLQQALQIFNANGKSQSVVTRDGQVIDRRGLMIGGSSAKLSGILAKKSEIRQLGTQIETLGQQLADARKRQAALESRVQQLENELQQQLARKSELENACRQSEKALYKLSEDLRHARRSIEVVRLEWEQYTGEEMDIVEELERHREILAQIDAEVQNAHAQVTETTRTIQALSAELEAFDRQRVELQLEATALETRHESSLQALKRLKSFYHDGKQRDIQLTQEIARKHSRQQAAEAQARTDSRRLADIYEALKHLEQTLETDQIAFAEIDSALQEKGASVSKIQSQRESMLEKIRLLELEQNRRQIESESIAKRLEESYHQPIGQLKNEVTPPDDPSATPGAAATAELEQELAACRRKLEKIGDVNLGAISEYDALKSRHEFLSHQQEDLVKAIDDLHKVVRKINRITQKRFLETFEAVNRKLAEVFPQLFEDGTAQLVLTDPSKPLETGVEFMVHPQGKKLTRMSLLSGGEKALAAIAFIFSIFLLKPAAFCLMDEIDAPLDESNVYRFNNMLKVIGEKSQIIIVTHNKKSMEFADMLFGVTMEKKGISTLVSVNLKQHEVLN